MLNYVKTYDGNQTLYRYMELDKLLYMLKSNSLVLPRITCFNDIFESSYPKKFIDFLVSRWEILLADGYEKFYASINKEDQMEQSNKWRRGYFISCWHANDFESEAMWNLYANKKKGIALVSSINRLLEFMPEKYNNQGRLNNIVIGDVEYIDFDSFGTEKGDLEKWQSKDECLFKRKSFEFENEVRIYVHFAIGYGNKAEGIPSEKDINEDIIRIPVDLSALIERIIIAPDSPQYHYEVVENIIDKYGLGYPL